jgi:SAM-dependent MidA family methyltransferase
VTALDGVVADLIRRRGPLPFDEVMDLALNDEHLGFYARPDSGAGRRGDFLTSPEVGPLFGAVVARALDTWWSDAGEPDPFIVVDVGAGPGTLARSVLHAGPACAPALRYVLVDASPAQRERHRAHLPLAEPAQALAPRRTGPDGEAVGEVGDGPVAVSLPVVPRLPVHVVLANELLDNLPIQLLERTGVDWLEVRAGLDHDDAAIVEQLVPAAAELTALADHLAPHAGHGSRIPLALAAGEWLRGALDTVAPAGGRVVVFDYTTEATGDLAARPQATWLRTYRGHERGGPPLGALGDQDVTCEIPIDQLTRVRSPDADHTQADWLHAHGLDELVEEGRRVWAERAATGDLEALRARSRLREAEALTAPDGLGAFHVLEWTHA